MARCSDGFIRWHDCSGSTYDSYRGALCDQQHLCPRIAVYEWRESGRTRGACVGCTHNEIRKQTRSYRYSGPTASINIVKGLRWRFGQVSVQRITRDVMTQLDSGTLYVTN
jgi:hypothetical protein